VGDSSEPRPSDGIEGGQDFEPGGNTLEDAARAAREGARDWGASRTTKRSTNGSANKRKATEEGKSKKAKGKSEEMRGGVPFIINR
jgi:hypothetical protein